MFAFSLAPSGCRIFIAGPIRLSYATDVQARKLAKILRRLENTRVLVVGDACLDANVYGRAEAVAKEAPVIALEAAEEVFAPGQATNVAANAAALGADVYFIGVAGDDERRVRLAELLKGFGVDAGGLVAEAGRLTTFKIKYAARETQRHKQHLFHVYRQEKRPAARRTVRRMQALAAEALTNARALVLSDYGNGTLGAGFAKWLIDESARRRLASVANARGDLKKFRGATAVVANMGELAALAGARPLVKGDVAAAMDAAAAKLKVRYLVITAGDEGMYAWPVRGRTRHLAPAAREVVDVTGAGDTVTAALAAALGAGLGLPGAAEFANLAAAAVVGREGTSVARAADLRRFL
jgi:rfaE bifunctional protein kinase chain/domain